MSKFAVSKPMSALVVYLTSPLIKNSKDSPPEPWKINEVSVAHIVTLDAAPVILLVIEALGRGLTVIRIEGVGTVHVTVFIVAFTSLL